MKTIAGSILVLAGAVLLQPAAEDHNRLDEAIVFAAPVLIFGLVILVSGLRSKS